MRMRAVYDRVLRYVLAIFILLAIAGLFWVARSLLDDTLVALLFLIPVGIITARWGLVPGILAALTAFLAFNFLFIVPYYTFTVHRASDLVVLLVFLVVAVVMSQLVARAQAGAQAAAAREREATQLYELSTVLAGPREQGDIAKALAQQMRSSLDCEDAAVELSQGGQPRLYSSGRLSPARPADMVASIQGVSLRLGEIRLWSVTRKFSVAEERLVRLFASQGALALERAALSQAEGRTRLLEESDKFKSALLSSVSHDLRTPLATIKAAASSLRSGDVAWDTPARVELLAAIDEETDHLNMLVGNLLDMSRIDSGALRPQRRWNVLLEIAQSVAERMRRLAQGRTLAVDVPENLPLVPVDFVQLGQVFTNLLSNSIKFAPPDSVVRVHARVEGDEQVRVQVSNEGPPVPEEHLTGIFDRFYRLTAADRVTGTGLGLSICKAIVEAHGGRIWAENLPKGFAFNFTLPLRMEGEAPKELPPEAG